MQRLDAARLFSLALEKAAPAGTRFHVDAEDVAFRDIAEVIGKRLNIPVASKSPEDAANHFGWHDYRFIEAQSDRVQLEIPRAQCS